MSPNLIPFLSVSPMTLSTVAPSSNGWYFNLSVCISWSLPKSLFKTELVSYITHLCGNDKHFMKVETLKHQPCYPKTPIWRWVAGPTTSIVLPDLLHVNSPLQSYHPPMLVDGDSPVCVLELPVVLDQPFPVGSARKLLIPGNSTIENHGTLAKPWDYWMLPDEHNKNIINLQINTDPGVEIGENQIKTTLSELVRKYWVTHLVGKRKCVENIAQVLLREVVLHDRW